MSQAATERVSMASRRLDAAWGLRPWSIDKVSQLRNEVEGSGFFTRDEKAADPASFKKDVERIEMLEELAWILTTAEEDLLPKFFEESNSPGTLGDSLRKAGSRFCEAVQVAKTRLFAAQNLPELRISPTGAHDPVCQYCAWGFDRLEQGRRVSRQENGKYPS